MSYQTMREETDAEFDDGGTPMWRARHVRVATVAVKPKPYVTPQMCFIIAFLFPFVVMFFVILAVCLIEMVRYGLPNWF